jgi:hypothetical protein
VLIVDGSRGRVSEMAADELAMLSRLKLPVDGTVRMACRTRIEEGKVQVDLDFQDTYDPADNSDFD